MRSTSIIVQRCIQFVICALLMQTLGVAEYRHSVFLVFHIEIAILFVRRGQIFQRIFHWIIFQLLDTFEHRMQFVARFRWFFHEEWMFIHFLSK